MADNDRQDRLKALFKTKQFDVEHALNMYAYSYVTMPAFGIYDENIIKSFSDAIKSCHIYIIGTIPQVKCVDIRTSQNEVATYYEVSGGRYELVWQIPVGTKIEQNEEGYFYVVDDQGQKFAPSDTMIMSRLSQVVEDFGFKVLYIGQAYGEDGSRSALDRLKKHETLQKISLQGIPNDRTLTILMIEIMPASRMMTMFNPWAASKDNSNDRLNKGLDVLFNTNEAQRTTIYEASLIRYFQPEFNNRFKDKFPSTNMKSLRQCYNKDINSVTAELCFDDIPFLLYSDTVGKKLYHIAHHDLHKDADRRVFFVKPNACSSNEEDSSASPVKPPSET